MSFNELLDACIKLPLTCLGIIFNVDLQVYASINNETQMPNLSLLLLVITSSLNGCNFHNFLDILCDIISQTYSNFCFV